MLSLLEIKPVDKTQDFVLFLPGLNMHINAFKEMAVAVSDAKDINTLIFIHNAGESLEHELEEFKVIFNNLKSKYPHSKFINIAHSYGSLLALSVQSDCNILISPALMFKQKINFISKLTPYFPNIPIPSFNLKQYRQLAYLSSSRYKELFNIQKLVVTNLAINTTDTLVFLNTKDELICDKKTHLLINRLKLEQWKLEEISPNAKPFGSHHLNLDSKSLGLTQFQLVTSKIIQFIN